MKMLVKCTAVLDELGRGCGGLHKISCNIVDGVEARPVNLKRVPIQIKVHAGANLPVVVVVVVVVAATEMQGGDGHGHSCEAWDVLPGNGAGAVTRIVLGDSRCLGQKSEAVGVKRRCVVDDGPRISTHVG